MPSAVSPQSVPPPQSSVTALLRGSAIIALLAFAYVVLIHEPVPRGVYDAVVAGDLAAVRERVADGGDVNWAPETGIGALHEAIFRRRTDIAEFLVAHGANVNAQGSYGDAPLHDVRDLALARLLLSRGARTDLSSKTLGTPLHAAVVHGQTELVAMLIEHGAKVDALDVNDSTPLHHAAGLGDVVSATKLMERGAPPNAVNGPGFTALHWAAGNGHDEMVRLLLARGADPNIRAMGEKSAADTARARGHIGIASLIDAAGSGASSIQREPTNP